jgi:hypothetical protein
MVGVMLMKQPFFIGGIEDVEVAKGSAFGAAGTFFFTFMVSILYLLKEGRQLSVGGVSSPSNSTGRGYGNRFGEYSTVGVVEHYDASAQEHSEGAFT